jgi:DHA2 family methylenomycin A resistance protein-like MFS transporter
MSSRARRTGGPLLLTVMCAGYFLVLLDVTIVNVALPRIASGLGAGVDGLQWVVDGYAIALASLMLAGGTAGDLYGHGRIVLAGFTTFGAASLGCALAPGVGALVAFRVLQGTGAALMLPGTLAVVMRAFPDERAQARAIGAWAGIGSLALAAGPLLGGALTQGLGWRAVFLVNVPIVLVAEVLAWRVVPAGAARAGGRLDRAGAALGGALLACVTFAFIQGGRSGADPLVVGAALLALMLAAAFLMVERRSSHPMLPLGLFRRPAFTTANAVAGTMNLATLGMLFVLTLYLQDVQHRSALAAGLALLPLFTPLSVLAPLGGRITAAAGPRWPMAAGLVAAGAGIAGLVAADADTSYLQLVPALLAWGIGLGVLTPAVVAAAVGAVPPERSGLASAVNNTARQACGAIGIAAFGALAGSPGGSGFLSGVHLAALIGAGLLMAAAAATLALIPRTGPAGRA